MKPRLYLETTIPGYLTSRPSRDLIVAGHQQVTDEWWRTRRTAFDLCLSQFVIDECSAGDPKAAQDRLELLKSFPLLDATEAVVQLATALVQGRVMPEKAARDAAHIAVCAVHAVDYLMTWNCRHIANAIIVRDVERICKAEGFPCPVICTPEELKEG